MEKWFEELSFKDKEEMEKCRLEYMSKDIIWNYTKLELAITDFCDLKCPNCSQAIPIMKNKKEMRIDQIKDYAYLTDGKFDIVKISGGEPTLHSEFDEILYSMPMMFPRAKGFEMATNGWGFFRYTDMIDIFDWICLSRYPGLNDRAYNNIINKNFPNVYAEEKIVGRDLVDINKMPNIAKKDIFEHCSLRFITKIVQDRIYPCCMLFAVSILRKMDRTKVSTPMDEDWKENLADLDYDVVEKYCRACPYNIDTSSYPVMVAILDEGKVREIYPFHKGDIAKANYGIKQLETK